MQAMPMTFVPWLGCLAKRVGSKASAGPAARMRRIAGILGEL